jgi:arylsulfatase A-like enzyme
MAGPGIKPGRIAETVSLTDLTPTLVELAGFAAPTGAAIDGRSIADLATGKRAPDPDGGIAFSAMIKDRSNPGGVTAVMKGRWKLIESSSTFELYDVHADAEEKSNIISTRPTVLEDMRALLRQYHAAAAKSPFE